MRSSPRILFVPVAAMALAFASIFWVFSQGGPDEEARCVAECMQDYQECKRSARADSKECYEELQDCLADCY